MRSTKKIFATLYFNILSCFILPQVKCRLLRPDLHLSQPHCPAYSEKWFSTAGCV